ncbi:DUF2786 domain-containing protein [Lactococcus petauri]|uniref:DUF2786 domain-containing protein n=1 Tax=Lactococcus petauri TaxID=1940789 RepID=A0AAJ2IW37_9LACT|nr:DUF2786 domain-containing protein [Lactococcus petauri]MDT2527135.1 DUF2786 domain-containing protein [Lactococcus petauri]MDT2541750.1 DUF2786 domain-containing protein [Lactococcus petauri]MDT2560458.1 DUF2786 domain-containing protein [Lactococcus petauri]MDT2568960.1 DUF2786 domain-containing protein [Lactococcus petauri]MDT2587922.1 DUF2786 domain-containing protein [Lactococcus petauri]
MNNKNNRIIKKIKGLLAISKDNANDEECQSAFVLAQKLMIQYQIDQSLIDETICSKKNINEQEVTSLKKLYRWERTLAAVVANNFRVKHYIKVSGARGKLIFYGLPNDLELSKEVYIFAYESILYFSKQFVSNKISECLTSQGKWDKRRSQSRRAYSESLKKAYIKGFLSGLNQKFSEQKSTLSNDVMLLTKVPEIVEESYKELSKSFSTYGNEEKEKKFTEEELMAYLTGVKQGKRSDLKYARIGD